jgi:hypothetical protein
MAEDMFEKAREAFFGSANIIPKVNAPSGGFLQRQSAPPSREVTGPAPDKHEGDQSLAFHS